MTKYRVSKKKTDTFVIQISREGVSFFLLTLYSILYNDTQNVIWYMEFYNQFYAAK